MGRCDDIEHKRETKGNYFHKGKISTVFKRPPEHWEFKSFKIWISFLLARAHRAFEKLWIQHQTMHKEDVNGDAGNTKMNKTQSP